MEEENKNLDLRRQSRAIRKNRWLIVLSLLAFISLAVAYWVRHMPEFDVKSVMLIEEESEGGVAAQAKRGGVSQMMRALSVGGFGSTSVDNERIIAETKEVFIATINDLHLNRTYVERDGLSRTLLYGNDCPIEVEAPNSYFDTLTMPYKIHVLLKGNKADVEVRKGWFKTLKKESDVQLPHTLTVPGGSVVLKLTTAPQGTRERDITVNVAGNYDMAQALGEKLTLQLYDKKSDAIEFVLKDTNRKRGIDILNRLMENYNLKRTEHKNEVARKEIDFFDNRISSLATDLAAVDNKMVEFKRQNDIVDIASQAEAMVKQHSLEEQEAVKLRAEMEINQMVLNALNKGGNNVLPMLGDEATAAAIGQYNDLIAQRQELERSAKPGNEMLVALNAKIGDARRSIVESAQKVIDASRIKLDQLSGNTARNESKMTQVPMQEKEYLNLLRDKELKNELFVFLMQRRESSMLKLTQNTSPSFIIDHAYASIKPSLVKPLVVTSVCLLLGLLLPLLWILYRLRRADRLIDAFDLPQWEKMCTVVAKEGGGKSDLRQLRAKIVKHAPPIKNLLVVDLSHNNKELLNSIVKTFEKVGNVVNTTVVPDADELHTPDFETKHDTKSAGCDYNVITIGDIDRLKEIEDLMLNDDNAALILVKSKSLKRRDFKTFVGDYSQPLDKVFIVINKL